MSYTNEVAKRIFMTVLMMNYENTLEQLLNEKAKESGLTRAEFDNLYKDDYIFEFTEEPDDFVDFNISAIAVKMKITCSQCGEVISEAEIDREENSKIIYCHQEQIRIDNVCCEECGNDLVDVDIEIEITTD